MRRVLKVGQEGNGNDEFEYFFENLVYDRVFLCFLLKTRIFIFFDYLHEIFEELTILEVCEDLIL